MVKTSACHADDTSSILVVCSNFMSDANKELNEKRWKLIRKSADIIKHWTESERQELDERVNAVLNSPTSEEFEQSKQTNLGTVIKIGSNLIKVYADNSYELVKTDLPDSSFLPIGTKFKL